MSNAQILALLSGLSDVPRPLAELLPGATRAVAREAADSLRTAGLAVVRADEGGLVARISAAGRNVVEEALAEQ